MRKMTSEVSNGEMGNDQVQLAEGHLVLEESSYLYQKVDQGDNDYSQIERDFDHKFEKIVEENLDGDSPQGMDDVSQNQDEFQNFDEEENGNPLDDINYQQFLNDGEGKFSSDDQAMTQSDRERQQAIKAAKHSKQFTQQILFKKDSDFHAYNQKYYLESSHEIEQADPEKLLTGSQAFLLKDQHKDKRMLGSKFKALGNRNQLIHYQSNKVIMDSQIQEEGFSRIPVLSLSVTRSASPDSTSQRKTVFSSYKRPSHKNNNSQQSLLMVKKLRGIPGISGMIVNINANKQQIAKRFFSQSGKSINGVGEISPGNSHNKTAILPQNMNRVSPLKKILANTQEQESQQTRHLKNHLSIHDRSHIDQKRSFLQDSQENKMAQKVKVFEIDTVFEQESYASVNKGLPISVSSRVTPNQKGVPEKQGKGSKASNFLKIQAPLLDLSELSPQQQLHFEEFRKQIQSQIEQQNKENQSQKQANTANSQLEDNQTSKAQARNSQQSSYSNYIQVKITQSPRNENGSNLVIIPAQSQQKKNGASPEKLKHSISNPFEFKMEEQRLQEQAKKIAGSFKSQRDLENLKIHSFGIMNSNRLNNLSNLEQSGFERKGTFKNSKGIGSSFSPQRQSFINNRQSLNNPLMNPVLNDNSHQNQLRKIVHFKKPQRRRMISDETTLFSFETPIKGPKFQNSPHKSSGKVLDALVRKDFTQLSAAHQSAAEIVSSNQGREFSITQNYKIQNAISPHDLKEHQIEQPFVDIKKSSFNPRLQQIIKNKIKEREVMIPKIIQPAALSRQIQGYVSNQESARAGKGQIVRYGAQGIQGGLVPYQKQVQVQNETIFKHSFVDQLEREKLILERKQQKLLNSDLINKEIIQNTKALLESSKNLSRQRKLNVSNQEKFVLGKLPELEVVKKSLLEDKKFKDKKVLKNLMNTNSSIQPIYTSQETKKSQVIHSIPSLAQLNEIHELDGDVSQDSRDCYNGHHNEQDFKIIGEVGGQEKQLEQKKSQKKIIKILKNQNISSMTKEEADENDLGQILRNQYKFVIRMDDENLDNPSTTVQYFQKGGRLPQISRTEVNSPLNQSLPALSKLNPIPTGGLPSHRSIQNASSLKRHGSKSKAGGGSFPHHQQTWHQLNLNLINLQPDQGLYPQGCYVQEISFRDFMEASGNKTCNNSCFEGLNGTGYAGTNMKKNQLKIKQQKIAGFLQRIIKLDHARDKLLRKRENPDITTSQSQMKDNSFHTDRLKKAQQKRNRQEISKSHDFAQTSQDVLEKEISQIQQQVKFEVRKFNPQSHASGEDSHHFNKRNISSNSPIRIRQSSNNDSQKKKLAEYLDLDENIINCQRNINSVLLSEHEFNPKTFKAAEVIQDSSYGQQSVISQKATKMWKSDIHDVLRKFQEIDSFQDKN